MNSFIEARPKATASVLYLVTATGASVIAADLRVPGDYPTIQAAVDAAHTDDTIHISPGVYPGQIVVLRKKLTLAGAPGAVIRATPGMPASLQGYDFCTVPLLGVALSDVTIKGLRFEGEHLADDYPCRLAGIIYSGSSGTIENCLISGFRPQTELGGFSGFGLIAGNNTTLGTGPVAVQVLNSTFQDNGGSILVKGADASADRLLPRLTFTIEGNTITGVGPTTNGTQIGIWVAPGATGEVRRNTITDHVFTGTKVEFSQGILAADWLWLQFDQTPPATLLPVVYSGNVFRNNQGHMSALYDNGSQIVNNSFGATAPARRQFGVAVSGENLLIATNRFSDMPAGITLLGDDPDFPDGVLGVAAKVHLSANRFCNVSTNVVIEPLTSNISEQGTLDCSRTPPTLAIAPAVLVSWPGEDDGWIIESAPGTEGPWAASDATPFVQEGRHSISVPADGENQFFRLR